MNPARSGARLPRPAFAAALALLLTVLGFASGAVVTPSTARAESRPDVSGSAGTADARDEGARQVSLDAGPRFACAVLGGGDIDCWGANPFGGGTDQPGPFVSVDVGRYHACGVRPGGAVSCWGHNTSGQATPPAGSFLAVSAGGNTTCAVAADRSLACWGANDTGIVSGVLAGRFLAVSVSRGFACGLRDDHTLACWGSQVPGSPPAGRYSAVSTADTYACGLLESSQGLTCWSTGGLNTPLPGAFVNLDVGWQHGCAVRLNGTVGCFGTDGSGQVSGTPVADRFMAVAATEDQAGTAADEAYSCGVREDGTLACWGALPDGQSAPTGSVGRPGLSTGSGYACVVGVQGTLTCFPGANPVANAAPQTGRYRSVTAGKDHACAVTTAGQAECWGFDFTGATTAPQGYPFLTASAGSGVSCAIATTTAVWCWGQIAGMIALLPGVVGSQFTGYVAVSAGGSPGAPHACAVDVTGLLACWGANGSGQISPLPSGVFRAVAAGGLFTCGVRRDGTIACWGAIAAPPAVTDAVTITAGWNHACVLRLNGATTCWGDNEWGKATPPAGDFLSISAGELHTCGIRPNGTVTCWGYSDGDVLGAVPSFGTPTTSGAVGQYFFSPGAEAIPPPVVTIASGPLPPGVALLSGNLQGVPTRNGVYPVTMRATNLLGTTDQAFTITVTAPLTVSSPSVSRVVGEPTGPLDPVYSGFLGGDDAGDLPTPATCTTARTVGSPPGAYPVTCSGVTGTYQAAYQNSGAVTVAKAATATTVAAAAGSATATVSVVAPGAGTPTGTVTFTANGAALAAVALAADGTAVLAQAPPAGATLTATYDGDGSFAGSLASVQVPGTVSPTARTTGTVTKDRLTARSGATLRVPFTLSTDAEVAVTVARRSTALARKASGSAGTNTVRIRLSVKGKPVAPGTYKLTLRGPDGAVLDRATVVVRRR